MSGWSSLVNTPIKMYYKAMMRIVANEQVWKTHMTCSRKTGKWRQFDAVIRRSRCICKSKGNSLCLVGNSTIPLHDKRQIPQGAGCWSDPEKTTGLLWTISLATVSLAIPTGLIHVTCVRTILTNMDSLPAPIDGRVEPLNANDSPLILIRETHQIQTTSQINRQPQGEGTRVRRRDNF